MALSGSLTKKYFYSNTHCHWIEWSATQSVVNNQSTVTIAFKSTWKSGFGMYSESKNINQIRFNGTNYTRSTSITGSVGTVTQFTTTQVITHNSDGTASFTLGGRHRLNSSYADYVYWNDVTFTLDTIPRASTLSSFSMGANLKVGTANSVKLGLSKANTSFKHNIYLKHGTTTIASWTNQDTPTSLSVTATQVNTLLARIPTATTAGMTLQVQTISGTNGSNVGGVLSRAATATVDSTVRPTATTPSVSIYGSGYDKTIGKYVQSKSRVTASFTSAAVGGASVVSHYMTVQRLSDGANSQTISGTSGTTGSPVTLSGTYRISTYVKDGRGRTAVTRSKDITVHAYAAPKISSFSVVRQSTATKLSISRNGTWSHLGGDNTLTIKVQYKLSTASSWTTTDTTTGTTGSFSGSFTKTGFDVLKSYDFLLTLTDQFGTKSTSVTNVSTQSVVLDIHKDEGIGIGKVHERGALDIAGQAYMDGFPINKKITDIIYFPASSSWYRVLEVAGRSFYLELILYRQYNSPAPEIHRLGIGATYTGGGITKIDSHGNKIFTNARLLYDTNAGRCYVDFKYNNSSYGNSARLFYDYYSMSEEVSTSWLTLPGAANAVAESTTGYTVFSQVTL